MNNNGWLRDEDLKNLTDNFFDDLIDPIDFPLEDIATANDDDGDAEGGDWDAGFQNLVVPPSLNVLTSFSSEFTPRSIKGQCVGFRKLIHSLWTCSVQNHSSPSSGVASTIVRDVKVSKLFQSSSPVSVLDNTNNGSTSSHNLKRAQRQGFPVKGGVRSKRKHPTTPRFTFFKSFVSATSYPDKSESETYISCENHHPIIKKKHKNCSAHSVSHSPRPFNSDGTIRKCTHCETTKTPQWREGPHGPRTLCNACGVRFRSGRLVPEYRPASSPSFVPAVHSNSHRKIIEMRRKDEDPLFFDNGVIRAVTSI
ncbi:unnamed protein product [Cochlearia groenlandica]